MKISPSCAGGATLVFGCNKPDFVLQIDDAVGWIGTKRR